MDTYEEARQHAIRGLRAAQLAHEREDWLSIEDGLEKYEVLLSRLELPPNTLLTFVLEFWSGWSDCAIHDWQFYEPLKKDDWLRLNSILLTNLEGNMEVTDEEIKNHFWISPRKPMLATLRAWFGGEKSNK